MHAHAPLPVLTHQQLAGAARAQALLLRCCKRSAEEAGQKQEGTKDQLHVSSTDGWMRHRCRDGSESGERGGGRAEGREGGREGE